MHGVSFLGQTTIRTRQIMLGFYPSVQITSQFMSHVRPTRLRTTSLHGKSNLARTMWLRPEQCGWEWWGYIQYMPYLASWRHRRCSTIKAVPRQSFVIHPNGGWWQSSLQKMLVPCWSYGGHYRHLTVTSWSLSNLPHYRYLGNEACYVTASEAWFSTGRVL
jgi:hypothetical protein